MAKGESGKWITIGGKPSEDGKRQHVGGSPVYVVGNRIVKGAHALTGRSLDDMKAAPELGSHRQQLHASREYEKALWHKRAREAGVNPSDLDTLAREMLAHDKAFVEDRKRMLADARKKFRFFGYGPEAITTNLRRKGEFELPHLDQVAEELRVEHPEQFLGHDLDLYDRLVDLLTEGTPQPMSTDEAYEQAFEHLQEYGVGGNEVSNEPLDIDDGPDFGDWSGGAAAPLIPPSPRPPAQIRSAWDRFFSGNEASGGGGSLFGSGDLAGRAALSRLPEGAGVLITEGTYKGATGKLVRDPHNNRVTVEIDNAPHLGQIPVTHEGIEPLSSAQSWRTEAASAPSEQRSLLSAEHFLPRRDSGEDEVPFSRDRKRETMNASWNRLTPRELQRRSDRVRRYSRDMGASPFDAQSFDAAEALDTATRGAEPSELDRALDEARQAVKDGRQTETQAIEALMARFGSGVDNNTARLLSIAFRRSLTSSRPVAAVFAELQQDQGDLPDADEREKERLNLDSQRIRYSRNHNRQPMPPHLAYTRQEVNEGAKLASKRGISFDAAVAILRGAK